MPNPGTRWIKARRSYSTGAVSALQDDGVVMRNSRRPNDHIHHSIEEFAIFIEAVKHGEFDHLVSAEPAG